MKKKALVGLAVLWCFSKPYHYRVVVVLNKYVWVITLAVIIKDIYFLYCHGRKLKKFFKIIILSVKIILKVCQNPNESKKVLAKKLKTSKNVIKRQLLSQMKLIKFLLNYKSMILKKGKSYEKVKLPVFQYKIT
jgi:hypothetical protein